MAMNIDSFKQLTTRIGHLLMRRCGSMSTLITFVVYAPKSRYDKEKVEAFYMDLEKFYGKDYNFYKVTVGDFNAKIAPKKNT
ncbi:hypothetical protein RB195_023758 [Necator americanus]|uniref:Uncharacterized protein n=1 Tax=Necator americanus TaxID=51031 RepID=A0ABR1EKM3_NECAM